jgi:hypothetical protein
MLSDACPFSPDVARFYVFAHHLAVFRRFRCNTGQRLCPCQVKNRRLPVFARHRTFPCFRPSLSRFQVFPLTRGNVCVRVKLRDACPFSPDVAHFRVFAHRLAILAVPL